MLCWYTARKFVLPGAYGDTWLALFVSRPELRSQVRKKARSQFDANFAILYTFDDCIDKN